MKKDELKQLAKSNGVKLGYYKNNVWKPKTIQMLKNELQSINAFNGAGLSVNETKQFLDNSYSKTLKNIDDYLIDKELSGQRVKVYFNPLNGKAVITHKGTNSIQDVGTDIAMTVGYKKGKRFTHSKNIQKQAEEKYGKKNIITLGHSLGAKLAEDFGSNEVITLNKPTLPADIIKNKKVKKNQTDIKTKLDPVSVLRKFQKGKKAKVIKSSTLNPLKEHSVSVLNRLDDNEFIGI